MASFDFYSSDRPRSFRPALRQARPRFPAMTLVQYQSPLFSCSITIACRQWSTDSWQSCSRQFTLPRSQWASTIFSYKIFSDFYISSSRTNALLNWTLAWRNQLCIIYIRPRATQHWTAWQARVLSFSRTYKLQRSQFSMSLGKSGGLQFCLSGVTRGSCCSCKTSSFITDSSYKKWLFIRIAVEWDSKEPSFSQTARPFMNLSPAAALSPHSRCTMPQVRNILICFSIGKFYQAASSRVLLISCMTYVFSFSSLCSPTSRRVLALSSVLNLLSSIMLIENYPALLLRWMQTSQPCSTSSSASSYRPFSIQIQASLQNRTQELSKYYVPPVPCFQQNSPSSLRILALPYGLPSMLFFSIILWAISENSI